MSSFPSVPKKPRLDERAPTGSSHAVNPSVERRSSSPRKAERFHSASFAIRPLSEDWDFPGKDWDDLSHEQRLKYLSPKNQFGKPDVDFFQKIPMEIKKPPSEKWLAKVSAAAEDTKRWVMRTYAEGRALMAKKPAAQFEDDDDDEEDDDGGYFDPNDPHNEDPVFMGAIQGDWLWHQVSEATLIKFVSALPRNLVFTASFHASLGKLSEKERCLCPCSSKLCRQWLGLTGLQGHVPTEKTCNRTFRDFALLAHLKAFEDPFHKAALVYVTNLYSKFYTKTLDHEALYRNVDHDNYERAFAFKVQQLENNIETMKEELRQWRESRDQQVQRIEEMESETHHNAVVKHRIIYDKLGLLGEKQAVLLTTEKVKALNEAYQKSLEGIKELIGVNEVKGKIKSADIPQNFKISELFRDWARQAKAKDKSLLFQDQLNDTATAMLLKDGEWNFATYAQGVRQDDKAVDKGGPTKHFLSEIWGQLGSLVITIEDPQRDKVTEVKLFAEDSSGVYPEQDDTLRFCIARALGYQKFMDGDERAVDFLNTAHKFYTAVGRLMIHSLATNNVLPYDLIPGLFRSYFFLNKTPTDPFYSKAELFQHLKELSPWLLNFTSDKDIRVEASVEFIETRTHTLEAILKGLTLNDKIDLSNIFFCRETQEADAVLLSPPDISVEMILKNIEHYKYRLNDESDRETELDLTQKTFINDVLPNVLRKKHAEEADFLAKFLKHVTGLPYLNRSNPTIFICFDENIKELGRPRAHTCECELAVPSTAYDANEERFEQYLDEAIANSTGEHAFTMQ